MTRRLANGARRDAGGLTLAERDALTHADSIWRRMGWYLTTDGSTRKATVLSLVAKGLVRELDELVVMCDGDGFHKEPERYRVGYELTDAGRMHVARIDAEEQARLDPCTRMGRHA